MAPVSSGRSGHPLLLERHLSEPRFDEALKLRVTSSEHPRGECDWLRISAELQHYPFATRTTDHLDAAYIRTFQAAVAKGIVNRERRVTNRYRASEVHSALVQTHAEHDCDATGEQGRKGVADKASRLDELSRPKQQGEHADRHTYHRASHGEGRIDQRCMQMNAVTRTHRTSLGPPAALVGTNGPLVDRHFPCDHLGGGPRCSRRYCQIIRSAEASDSPRLLLTALVIASCRTRIEGPATASLRLRVSRRDPTWINRAVSSTAICG